MSRSPFILIAATLMLGACAGAQGPGPTPLTPTSRYALQIESDQDRVALAVHANGLSANQARALDDMVNRFNQQGAPLLRIEAPSGEDPVALEVAWRIKSALEARGVPADRVQLLTYLAPDPRAPVLVGFDTVRAAVPQCGTSWTNLARTGANAGSANFGCAVNSNLAAQIADPRDIVAPRPVVPSSAARRALVFDRYRSGTPTSATREPMVESQRVADAVN